MRMLIRFTVSNFLTFQREQEFSLVAGKVRTYLSHIENIPKESPKIKLLKFSAIYGANAAGKSNFVNAMKFARSTIIREIPQNSINMFCRTQEENKDLPSKFEFEIQLDNKSFAYGFDIILHEQKIIGEWLYELTPKGEYEIFSRKPTESSIEFGDKFIRQLGKESSKEHVNKYDKQLGNNRLNVLRTYAEGIKTNTSVLYLTEMNRNKGDMYKNNQLPSIFQEVYLWFKNTLVINHPDAPISPAYFIDPKVLEKVNTIMSDLGLGINTINIVEAAPDEVEKHIPRSIYAKIIKSLNLTASSDSYLMKDVVQMESALVRGENEFFVFSINPETKNIVIQKLTFEHAKNKTVFELFEESDGTRRLLDLTEIIVSALSKKEKVYVIDEINRCLHPQVTYRFIAKYLSSIEDSRVQLIVTTHESHLMDLNLLRRDEIWFVDKDDNGESEIYSLDRYNARFDKKIRRAYLDGRYGGVPLFDTYYPMEEK